ncbi:branched-chain amino acid ABC transporter substrate-binding protein [Noviherbaspirillum sp. Root189]|uniref:branched-chain amino acid ABC transporter substrate-binding protein n=1 Tax=Noviherbaspirillum sp. Root189 TaxID=1736487 RepID=UPI0007098696|nr:branched-chain amino acid ABC transporter substrate-binding protein [Noviherbaspirillum sp. Root189]KRB79929.1 branched-chain amino acid ABC transporter substrate-binding protein [Noviherbaspirillum sp. Root189]
MKKPFRYLVPAKVAALALVATSAMADTVKIAVIDPLSGPFAALGENQLKSWQFMGEVANKEKWAGEHTLEFVAFDNKASPQESLNQLKRAIDGGFRYIAQANGSGAGLALIDAINKYNERNPGKEVIYINHGAVDPELTNGKCSFWHFSFDSNSDMKMQALVEHMSQNKSIKKVYIIGQDYAFGRSVSRTAKEYLKGKRPDVEIVGDDLHPIGQVKDFAPYVSKIKASGADTVITGNWGADLSLLIKASKDAGVDANFYTYYAVLKGAPTAMGSAGAGKVKYVGVWNVNNESGAGKDIVEAFKAKFNDDYTWMQTHSAVTMLSKAIREAKTTDPVKVALKMEGMTVKSLNGDVTMRAADHQLQQPLYIAVWSKAGDKDVRFDQEGTGFGWKTEKKVPAEVATQPTACKMKRPAS